MRISRLLLGVLFLAAGALHFAFTRRYIVIIPAWLPAPHTLVFLSGAAEIAGGLGLLAPNPALQRAAAWGLTALLLAVFPANIYMATHSAAFPATPAWALWARLPLQLPLLWWAWLYTRAA